MDLPFGDWTDSQVKCAAWLLIYAGEAKEVIGGDLRRYSFGLIRRNVHKMIDEWRVAQLMAIRALVVENEDAIFKAYQSDIGKPYCDWFMERKATLAELDHTMAHLAQWMQPEHRSSPLWMQPSRSFVLREPLGVVFVTPPTRASETSHHETWG